MTTSLSAAASPPPNIVFLVADDQRSDAIAALGNTHIQTPNLDKLVRSGTAFTNAFCMGSNNPAVCSPSRAMFLTGRPLYHAIDLAHSTEKVLPNYPTFPETFRNAGYTTCGVGKWHNPKDVYARSFSTGGTIFFGGMGNQFHVKTYDYDPSGEYPPAQQHAIEKHSAELFADTAIDFLRKDETKTKPFFLYVAFTVPHDPRQVPPEFAHLYDGDKQPPAPANFLPEHPFDNGEMTVRDEMLIPAPRTAGKVRADVAKYYCAITHLDAQVGRILDALDATGTAANTLVIYTSDHGLSLGSHGLLGKQSLYTEAMRSPLLMRGPGVPKDVRSPALCYLFDVFPTACELTGIAAPKTVEGKSLAPLFKKPEVEIRDHLFGTYRAVQRSLRTPEWKFILYPKIGREQLFHSSVDPDEMHDLAADPAAKDKLVEMREKLLAAQRENDDPLLRHVPEISPPDSGKTSE